MQPALPLFQQHPQAVLADGTPLLSGETPRRHPLRRSTDCRDVVDVEAVSVNLRQQSQVARAYYQVSQLAQPHYRSGVVLDLKA